MKTGVQEVLNGLKILDSGFRRNDGQTTQTNFFTASGDIEGFALDYFGKIPPTPLCKGGNIIYGQALKLFFLTLFQIFIYSGNLLILLFSYSQIP